MQSAGGRINDRVLLVGTAEAVGAAVVGVARVAGRPVVGARGRDAGARRGGVVLAVGAADRVRGRTDLGCERAVVGRAGASTLFPYTTLFRSRAGRVAGAAGEVGAVGQ